MNKMEAGPCFCPAFHQAVELIGRKWTGAIIRAMLYGRIRFSEIQAAIPGLSDRMLSERLQELALETFFPADDFTREVLRQMAN